MTTQIQLHERTDEMSREMLVSEGVIGGPFAQLLSPHDYFDEFNDALDDADRVIVGPDSSPAARNVRDLFNGPTTVTDDIIETVRRIFGPGARSDGERVAGWLAAHRGAEVFAIAW